MPEYIAGWQAIRDWWGDRDGPFRPDMAAHKILNAAEEHGVAREVKG